MDRQIPLSPCIPDGIGLPPPKEGLALPEDRTGPRPAHIAYWDRELRNRLANEAFAQFAGRSVAAAAGEHARDLLGPELFELNRPYAERALAGQQQRFDRSVVDPDGVARHFEAVFIPDVVDGEVRGFYAIVTDVSAGREDARMLSASESVFRRAFLASPVGKATFDETGRLLQANPALGEMLGTRAAELTGRALVDLLAEDQEAEWERLRNLFEGKTATAAAEKRLRRSDGSQLWVILSLALSEAGENHGPLGIAQFVDIGQRKRAEDELRESRARLNEAERIARMGSWELDIARGRSTWSAGLYAIFGMSPGEDGVVLEEGLATRVFADDHDQVRETLSRAIAERSAFDLEYRVIRADGRVRVLHTHGEVVVNADGEAERMVGIARDVTDAALARDALERAGADMQTQARELQRLARASSGDAESMPAVSLLTRRQLEVVELIAEGLTNAAIAKRLFLSEATIKWHVKQILQKTSAANRAEAVALVLGAGR